MPLWRLLIIPHVAKDHLQNTVKGHLYGDELRNLSKCEVAVARQPAFFVTLG